MNNNPETYLLSHNRFIDYIVLVFVDRKKAQIYTFPNRVDEHDLIKLILVFNINDYLDQIKTANVIISEHLNMKIFCSK